MATSNGHFLEGKKIIVAGAGIAGLSFVAAMRKLWDSDLKMPEIDVYDRDTRELSISREGYSLSLHAMNKDGGLVALKNLGLLDEILAAMVLNADSFKMWDQDWNELIAVKPKPYGDLPIGGMRIARRELRSILASAAEAAGTATIHWGSPCVAARRLDNGRMAVSIARNGDTTAVEEHECDLLIAADGSHSRIRGSFRPDDGLNYAGPMQMGGNARFPNGIPPPFDKSWGLAVTGQGVCCFFSPVDKESVVWAISQIEPERPRLKGSLTPEQFAAVAKEAKELGHMFAKPFDAIVDATDPATAFLFPAKDKKPFKHDDSLRGVIFVGDANHAVSPFAGNGANLALMDGWDLADQLCKSRSVDQAVIAYDRAALPRAEQTLKTSHQRISMGMATGVKATLFRAALAAGRFLFWITGK